MRVGGKRTIRVGGNGQQAGLREESNNKKKKKKRDEQLTRVQVEREGEQKRKKNKLENYINQSFKLVYYK